MRLPCKKSRIKIKVMRQTIRTWNLVVIWVSVIAQDDSYQKPKLENEESLTMVIIPDPQSYVKFGRNQGIFDLMTAWIEEQIEPMNIGMVLCTGDLVEQNNILKGDGRSEERRVGKE